jgi:hypothetical protein
MVGGLRVGEWVYLHPDENDAPREARGLTGRIERFASGRAVVSFRGAESAFLLEVDPEHLRHERRRRHRQAAPAAAA